MPRILFIGDVVGKPGRKILREVLPVWKEKYQPDAVIVNVENIAHGKGVTPSIMAEVEALGIDAYTSGNHVFDKLNLAKTCFEQYPKLVRPANYQSIGEEKSPVPGYGYYRFAKELAPSSGLRPPSPLGEKEKMNSAMQQYLIINLNGQVFMENQFSGEIGNPFLELDKLLTEQKQNGDIIIVDLHAEATSEKIAMGYYADGRVTAVLGTHTHVPTADARVLPKGTAHISDVGMTGALNGVLGVKKENALTKFLDPSQKFKNELEEDGPLQINGVLIETSGKGQATRIEKLYQEIFT